MRRFPIFCAAFLVWINAHICHGAGTTDLTVMNTHVGPLNASTYCTAEKIALLLPDHTVLEKKDHKNHTSLLMPINPIWVAKDNILHLIIVPKEKDRYSIDHIVIKTPKINTLFQLKIGDTFTQARRFLNLEKCVPSQQFHLESRIACPALLAPNIWYGFGGAWPKSFGKRPPGSTMIPAEILSGWKVYEIIWFPKTS